MKILKYTEFELCGHILDFSNTYPKFDGKSLCSKQRVVDMFKFLLKESGYVFEPVVRPVPAILLNYQFIDKRYLFDWIKRCCLQMVILDSGILKVSTLDFDGFCFTNVFNGNKERIVRLTLDADNYHYDCCTTIGSSAAVIQRFMNTNFRNKCVYIQ